MNETLVAGAIAAYFVFVLSCVITCCISKIQRVDESPYILHDEVVNE